MGQSKSKQLYAFQPLPWPEALTAFRLVDQICGIATAYATTHLGDQEGLVLGKVNELQRLPHLWDVFEGDFERLRGSHTLRLATELHNAVEKLEGCKYDLGVLAEKGLMFKSQRKAAYKVLALLREVEEAHRAFHYAFELALYASLRDESAAATPASGDATSHGNAEAAPLRSSRGGGGGGFGGSSRGGRGTSGGGTGFRSQSLPLPLPHPDAAVEEPAAVASTGRPPSAAEDPWMGTTNRTASLTPEAASRVQRAIEAAAPAADAAAPEEVEPVAEPTGAVPSLTTSSSPPQRRRSRRTEEDATRRSTARSAGSSGGVRSGGGRSSQADSHQQRQQHQHQHYVVMYLPQGPDGGGPRAILVPSASLQPAPAAALPMTTTATSMYGTDRAGHPAVRAAPPLPHQQPLPAAAPSLDVSSYFAAPTSQPLPPAQQPSMHYAYAAPSPPPPMTTTAALASKPYSTTSYMPLTRRNTQTRLSRTLSDLAERTARTTRSQATSSPPSYRYFSQAPATAPSLRRSSSTYNATADRGLPSADWYGNPARQHYHSPPPPALRSASARSPPSKTTASPLATAPAVDLDAYLNRPLYSNSSGGGSWWASSSPPPPAAAPQSVLLSSPPAVPPQLSSPISPAGAVAAVVPGAPPGSIMMLQPLSAHKTATGALVLQPQSDPSRPPMLVVAQDPSTVAAAATGRAGPGVMALDAATAGDGGGRVIGAPRWRRSGRRDDGGAGGDPPYGLDADPGAGLYGGGDEEYDDDDEAHLTYVYGLETTGRRAEGRDGDPSARAYLTHYLGRRDEVDTAEEEEPPPPPEYPEVYGGGRVSGGKAGGGGGRERVRDRSGGAAQQLMSRYRDRWDEDAAAVAIAEDSRCGGRAGARQAPLSVVRASAPRPLNARDNEVDFPSTTPPRRRRSSPSTAVRAWAPAAALSYERLAALAGLDPDVLGGGGSAGMASLPDRTTAPSPAVRTAIANGSVPASSAAAAARRTTPYVVPGEPELQRAELLAAAVEEGDWAAAVGLAGLVRAGWWGDPRDGAVARGLLLQAALRGGSADAHAALGEMAERGEGLPAGRPDLAAAARHYGAAAAGGHRDATTAYAYLLEHGLGVIQDEARAAQLYAAAAERNCPTAANNLAKMILDGRGGITSTSTAANGTNRRVNSGKATASGSNGNVARWATSSAARAAVLAAANGTNGNGNGNADSNNSLSPAALAKALFRRAAKAGSASAWYNLGVCYLQQLKHQQPQQRGGGGGGARVRGQAYDKEVDELEGEALRCFAEAAKWGHARAALRAGHMRLQRSAAAAAVDAFATAAINAAASGAAAAGGGGRRGDGVDARASNGGGKAGAAGGGGGGGAMAQIEAEALWCLAQLAERQAAVLEVKGVAATTAAEIAAAAAEVAAAMPNRASRRGGDGGGSGGARSEVNPPGSSGGDGDDGERNGDEEGGGGAASGGSPRGSDAAASRRASRADLDGDGDGGGTGAGAGAGMGDDAASSTGTGAESRAVGQMLATLAAGADGGGPEGVTTAAAATAASLGAAILDDPAATAAVEFARELCRIDFECCRQPAGPLFPTGTTASAVQPSGAVKLRGLRRLRRQARDLLAEAADGTAADDVDDVGSLSLDGSVSGGAADGSPMASALARLDLQLQQPGERAQHARRAAADLMGAAAALGHPAAQHWLAGWLWSMGNRAAAVALWEAAGRRRYGGALMVLGQMAEAGELPAAEAETGTIGDRGGGGGGSADLAAAARYYLRAQEAGAPGAVEAMRRVQRLLQRHVALQGKLEAVAAGGASGGAGAGTGLVAGATGGSLGPGGRRRM